MLVEVTTATDASGNEDATTTEDGVTAILSIPVVVGDDTPSLECPSSVIPMSAGQLRPRHRDLLQGFTVDPRDAAGLDFSAEWSRPSTAPDVEPQGSVVAVTASDDAIEGGEAVLTVRAGESNPQEVRFRLAAGPAAAAAADPGRDHGGRAEPSYDIGAYLEAGVAEPSPPS